ncbi:MAG: hypothetical protein WBF53_02295, partial [Litorimonas sp.]
MEGPTTDPLAEMRGHVERPVWSLIVTILGDASHSGSEHVGGGDLNGLLSRLDVRPQAIRTALHRLRADGWIETRRVGRNAFHGLTISAQAETRRAAPRIYDLAEPPTPALWTVVFGGGEGVPLGDGLTLRPGPLRDEAGIEGICLQLGAAQMERLWPPDLRGAAIDLQRRLGAVVPRHVSPVDVAALRTLLVHD